MECADSSTSGYLCRVRGLIGATYSGRDDLCAAASRLSDEQLSNLCRGLADDLADHAAYLRHLRMSRAAAAESLAVEILRFFRDRGWRNRSMPFAVERPLRHSGDRYDIAIAATGDPEARALLRAQSEHLHFAERLLRGIEDSCPCDDRQAASAARHSNRHAERDEYNVPPKT
jgi:hypothetical protein